MAIQIVNPIVGYTNEDRTLFLCCTHRGPGSGCDYPCTRQTQPQGLECSLCATPTVHEDVAKQLDLLADAPLSDEASALGVELAKEVVAEHPDSGAC